MDDRLLNSIGVCSFILVILAMILVESRWPFFPFFKTDVRKRLKHGAINGGLALCSMILTRLVFIKIWSIVCSTQFVGTYGLANWLKLPQLSHIVFVVCALDLWTYWWHRLNHTRPFLWRFHRVHHSDTTMDVSTSFRFHPGEIFFSSVLRLGILAGLGARIEELILYEILMTAVEVFHHTNFQVSPAFDSRLRAVIASPMMHKRHHANDKHVADSNYSVLFSIWDRIFGSLAISEKPEEIRYGIMDFNSPHQLSFVFLMLMPFASRKSKEQQLLHDQSFFSGDAEDYAKYRPSYPPKIAQFLKKEYGLQSEHIIADVGSGTGLSSKLFLKFGCPVYGIEPDPAMRTIAEKKLADFDGFTSIDGVAGNTSLPAHVADFVVSAQAFQWFDQGMVKPEFKRILKPDGYCIMLWNQHPFRGSAMAKEFDHLLHEHLPEFAQTTQQSSIDELLGGLFDRDFKDKHFKNYHVMNYESFLGWTKSYAFNLQPDDPGYNPLMQGLRELYEKYNDRGHVTFEYMTHIYIGRFNTSD